MAKKEKGTGTSFEEHVQIVAAAYEVQGRAALSKQSAPVLVLMGGRKVIPLKNPYLDFSGTWIERGGRALHIEAKASKVPRLPIYVETKGAGLTTEQIESLERWRTAKAAVLVLWEHDGEVRGVTLSHIYKARDEENRMSVPWAWAYPIPKGEGLVSFDFLALLAQLYPCTAS